jgi:hypothetical protein
LTVLFYLIKNNLKRPRFLTFDLPHIHANNDHYLLILFLTAKVKTVRLMTNNRNRKTLKNEKNEKKRITSNMYFRLSI